MIDTKDARKKYNAQKNNAKRRSIKFCITFEEWLKVWETSGKWYLRGRGADKYCMCRIGDTGSYCVENIFIGQGKQNVRDGNLGKVLSDETKQKMSAAQAGKPKPWVAGENNPMHRPEVKAKMSIAVGGSNNYKAKTVICPFGKFGSTTDASKELGIPAVTIQWRCRHNFNNEWSYAQEYQLWNTECNQAAKS